MLLSLYFDDVFVNNDNLYLVKINDLFWLKFYHMWLGNHLVMTDVIVIILPFLRLCLTEKQLLLCMADLIAIVADVIATY